MKLILLKFITWSGLCLFGVSLPLSEDKGWTLRVIHTNDMHSRFEQTSALSTKCHQSDVEAGKCFGGFARIATLVRQTRNSSIPSLFLNAGDTYQGTLWFSVHKWRIVTKFLNLLQPDAISLGNHEFDDGPEGLAPFLQQSKFPIVTANVDFSDEPKLSGITLEKSVILNVTGHRIGVIGYLTPDTKMISSTGKVKFMDEVESIKKEVKILQEKGVKILIAVGHSGFNMDKKIAAEVDGLDLVIGGHTNTFLYTGKKPNLEEPEGLYPTEIVQKNGRKVYVVQAYAYTKYLGNLTVDFDSEGEITKIQGDPVLVDNSIEQAQDILDELEQWRGAIVNMSGTPVGKTRVLLDGDSKHCRTFECNLGNLITDAMIDYNSRQYAGTDGWTDAAIALFNSGSIRTSIETTVDNEITMGDILAVLPFGNSMVKLEITGKKILEVLEHSVRNLQFNNTSNLDGGFLQFSGLQVIYNLSQPSGSRVVPGSVFLRCASCRVPALKLLDQNKTYAVLAPDFVQSGGDGYSMLMNVKWTPLGIAVDELVADYLKMKSPVHPGVEWRINFIPSIGHEYKKNIKVDNYSGNHGNQVYGSIVIILMPSFILSLVR